MKKIFIAILVLISVQSFGQTKKYFERMSPAGVIDSGYVKVPGDSIFLYGTDGFVSRTKEYYDYFFNPEIPNGFSNFTLCADGVYRNFIPRANVAMAVDYTNVANKPSTFPADPHTHTISELSNASTVGGNLLALNTPVSNSIPVITSAGNAVLRTEAQIVQDLGIDLKASLTGSEVITNKTLGAFNVGIDAGANDSYAVTLSPAPAAYTQGMIVIFRANTANTTVCSINVNGLGAVNIVKRVSTNTATGDILAQMWCMLIYSGTNFVLLNPVVN